MIQAPRFSASSAGLARPRVAAITMKCTPHFYGGRSLARACRPKKKKAMRRPPPLNEILEKGDPTPLADNACLKHGLSQPVRSKKPLEWIDPNGSLSRDRFRTEIITGNANLVKPLGL